MSRRIREHKRNSKSKNSKLYYAIRKYGIDQFHIEIISQTLDYTYSKDVLEPYFIKHYKSFKYGYNMTLGGDGCKGYSPTDKTRKKLRDKNKGQIPWNKGKIGVYSDETLEKMRASSTGMILTDEQKQHLSTINKNNPSKGFSGKTHTDEFKKMMSRTQTGRRNGKTYEDLFGINNAIKIKQKQSRSLSGKNNPMYGKTKELNPFYGKKHSAETLELMRQKQNELTHARFGKDITVQCPYCNKVADQGNGKRWHFNNCKFKI